MQATGGLTEETHRSTRSRTLRRLLDIQAQACRLVLDRGYDGFTMDELAEAVGVSRRTLFNYVPDKPSAVLGLADAEQHPSIEAFQGGGPQGALIPDLVYAIDHVIDDADKPMHSVAHHRLVEQAIARDPKVTHLALERFTQLSRLLTTTICAREGWEPNDLRAQTISATYLALIKLALDQFTQRGSEVDFRTLFHEVLDADRAARSLT